MIDDYRHKGLRRQLVSILREKGIQNEAILAAIEAIPRHFFLDKAFEEWAYQDKAFPIGKEQTISQPYTVAYQSDLLEVREGTKILEIGTGSGYQATILAILGATVYTIERHEFLYEKAKALLKRMGIQNVHSFLKDGYQGLSEFAPFDGIIVTAAAEELPKILLEQLAIGGILVIPIGKENQQMYKIKRLSATKYSSTALDHFRFVPFLKGIEVV